MSIQRTTSDSGYITFREGAVTVLTLFSNYKDLAPTIHALLERQLKTNHAVAWNKKVASGEAMKPGMCTKWMGKYYCKQPKEFEWHCGAPTNTVRPELRHEWERE